MAASGTVRPVVNRDAQKVCSLSGAQKKIYEDKKVTLTDLIKMLDSSIKEAEQARSNEKFWTNALITAKLIKVAADVAMDVLENFTGPAGKAVNVIYSHASFVTDGLNGQLDDRKVLQQVGENHVDALSATLESLDKTKASKVVGGIKTFVKAAQGIAEVVEDYKGSKESGVESSKKNLMAQMKKIKVQIIQIDADLASCKAK
ncbi:MULTISPECIES: hypothetical protein [unclassified Methylobacterium]|uniref:hypothetical protein n=1 Tax=unclassified Methylobacterium TaxID=2615210 RepID=UPI00226A1ADA|nr:MULTISPECIES: hypothetical protein [unclassified Methylobacterium]